MGSNIFIQNLTTDTVIHAFTSQYPVFMSLLTIIGLFILIFGIYTISRKNISKNRNTIFGAGLIALITGLLVFPLEALNTIEAYKAAQAPDAVMAITPGGIYITFVPFLYGIFWFLVSLICYTFSKIWTQE
jgi:hypothetical protein